MTAKPGHRYSISSSASTPGKETVISSARCRHWLVSYLALLICLIMGVAAGTLARQDRWLETGLVIGFTAALAWIARPPPARSGPPRESAPPPPDH
jgi:hypothetical protein